MAAVSRMPPSRTSLAEPAVSYAATGRLRVRHRLLDVLLAHAGQRHHRVPHAVHVLAQDVDLPVVAQEQVVVHVDGAAKRVLDRDGRVLDLALCEAGEHLVEGIQADEIDLATCSREDVCGALLAVGTRLALVCARGHRDVGDELESCRGSFQRTEHSPFCLPANQHPLPPCRLEPSTHPLSTPYPPCTHHGWRQPPQPAMRPDSCVFSIVTPNLSAREDQNVQRILSSAFGVSRLFCNEAFFAF
eukprot:scaffold97913_cov66-Phaeocystis_antarctica.AAC.2